MDDLALAMQGQVLEPFPLHQHIEARPRHP
jgi:hypothetical protein